MKPAEQTPLTCLRMAQLAKEAGIPDGVINVVPGYGPTAGAAVVKHPGVDKIAFTANTELPKSSCAMRPNRLKRLTFELGGKSPNVVLADANLDRAAMGSYIGLFLNQGQCCCAGSRVFVERKAHDEFMDKLTKLTKIESLEIRFHPTPNKARRSTKRSSTRSWLHRERKQRRSQVRIGWRSLR